MRLERLSLEQGTMDGPASQSEHAADSERKRLTTKVLSQKMSSCPAHDQEINE